MNRGVLIHGALLTVALIFGYQTLRDDGEPGADLGDARVWSVPEESIRALTYISGRERVRIERRSDGGETYLWGKEVREEREREQEGHGHHHGHGHDHGHDHGGADHDHGGADHDHGGADHDHDYRGDYENAPGETGGGEAGDVGAVGEEGGDEEAENDTARAAADGAPSGADERAERERDGERAGPETEPDGERAEPEDERTEPELERVEFPVGETGAELLELYAELSATRDLGALDPETRARYEAEDGEEAAIALELADGSERRLELGARVYGGADRYVFEEASGRGYVLASRLHRDLAGGQSTLRLESLYPFDADELRSAEVETARGARELDRLTEETGARAGGAALGDADWALAGEPGEPSPLATNFIGQLGHVRPRAYPPNADREALEFLFAVHFRGGGGESLGTLEVYADAPLAEADEDTTYYARTERTRVLGELGRLAGESLAGDAAELAAGDLD